MTTELAPLHRYLEYLSPLSEQRALQLVQFVVAHTQGTVVDIGCGWAGLLTRVLEASSGIRGIGIDLKSAAFPYAMKVAAGRGVAARLQLIAGDAKAQLPASAEGAICIGATQVWGPPVEAKLPLNYAAALSALRRLVVPGAPVVYGEGIWSATPTEAAVAPLAGRKDELLFLPDLVELAWSSGFTVSQTHEANQDEWDQFESGYSAADAEWLAKTERNHSGYAAISERAHRQRDAYFRGYRGVLGMAYLCLLAR